MAELNQGGPSEVDLETARLLKTLNDFGEQIAAAVVAGSGPLTRSGTEAKTVEESCAVWSNLVRKAGVGHDLPTIESFIADSVDFIQQKQVERLLDVGTRAVPQESGDEDRKAAYAKLVGSITERVLLVQMALRDLTDPIMAKEEPPGELSLATPAELAIGKVRAEWKQVMTTVREAHEESAEPPGQTIIDTFSDALELVNGQCTTVRWPDVTGEVDRLCNETVDLIVNALDLAEELHTEFNADLLADLDAEDKVIAYHFDLICEYLKAIRLKAEDNQSGGGDDGQDEFREFEAEFVELTGALAEACAEGDAQDADDITAGISNLTINVLSAAEGLSLRLSEEAKEDLLGSIEKLFVLAERQASNTQLLINNPGNEKAKQRLGTVNNDLRKAVGIAIGKMVRTRDSFTGGWLAGFSAWRASVRDEQELRAERDLPLDFSLTPEPDEANLPADVAADLAESRAFLADIVKSKAASLETWQAELHKRAEIEQLRVRRELDDRRSLRNNRLTEYEMKAAGLVRDRLMLDKEVQKELNAEAARIEATRLRDEARVREEAQRQREEARMREEEERWRVIEEARRREKEAERKRRQEAEAVLEAERKRREEEEAAERARQEAEERARQEAEDQALQDDLERQGMEDLESEAEELEGKDEERERIRQSFLGSQPPPARANSSPTLSRSDSLASLGSRVSHASAASRASHVSSASRKESPENQQHAHALRGSASEMVLSSRSRALAEQQQQQQQQQHRGQTPPPRAHSLANGNGGADSHAELPPIPQRTAASAQRLAKSLAASRPRSASSLSDADEVVKVRSRWQEFVRRERPRYVPPPGLSTTPLKPKSLWTPKEVKFSAAYGSALPKIASVQQRAKRKPSAEQKAEIQQQMDRKRKKRAAQIKEELKKLKRADASSKPVDPEKKKALTKALFLTTPLRAGNISRSPTPKVTVDKDFYTNVAEQMRAIDPSLPADERVAMRRRMLADVREKRLAKYATESSRQLISTG